MGEVVAVSHTSCELFVDDVVVRHDGLTPATAYEFGGLAVRTLDDIGPVRAVVATVNDVHFGEVECGKVEGSRAAQFSAGPGEAPYPEVMNASVIADIGACSPDAVIVKGDLTSFGTLAEYASFLSFYEPAFGARLTHVRGNHDSYPGEVFADWPVQVVDVPGLRVVLLDTARDHQTGGSVSAAQVDETVAAADATTDPVIVMGHHPLFAPDLDNPRHFDGVTPEDSAALVAALVASPNVVAYTAGHTHRCRRVVIAGLPSVEVACVKDYPGAWAEYLIGETGIAQVVHRARGADAVAWAEKTRGMFDGYYGTYAMGELADRCFTLSVRRWSTTDASS
jgi:3',5'-cyclic-AMP phosphodiesterase